MKDVVSRFSDFYQQLNNGSMTNLDGIYHENVVFIDPVGQHESLKKVQQYFAQLLENTIKCEFLITSVNATEEITFVTWVMRYAHPKLARGHTIKVEGISQLKIEHNLIVFQQDYYDLGAMLYEHVPFVGRIIHYLKTKLKNN